MADDTLEALEKALLVLKSGSIDPFLTMEELPRKLQEILQKAFDSGLPLSRGIENFIAISRTLARNVRQNARLRHVILIRWTIVLFLAIFVRSFFIFEVLFFNKIQLHEFSLSFLVGEFFSLDFQGGLLLATWGLGAILMLQPKNWMWNTYDWNQKALDWLESYINGCAKDGHPWYQKIEHYQINEYLFGVSLLPEKQQVLIDYASDQTDEFLKKHQFMEDILPLWELLVLAPVMFLFMALPAVSWVIGH